MSQAAALSIVDSSFAPEPRATGSAKLVSQAQPAGTGRSKARRSFARLEAKLSRRTRILFAGLLMIATSFGLSMLIVAINSL